MKISATGFRHAASAAVAALAIALGGCTGPAGDAAGEPRSPEGLRYLNQPLVTEIYTADPSAHVFEGRIYIYGSHDVESGIPQDDQGSHFDMRDYRVLSMDRVGGSVTVYPVALHVDQVPWATRQMWAPDAAFKNGRYYLYFPAKDQDSGRMDRGADRRGHPPQGSAAPASGFARAGRVRRRGS